MHVLLGGPAGSSWGGAVKRLSLLITRANPETLVTTDGQPASRLYAVRPLRDDGPDMPVGRPWEGLT